MSNDAKLNLLKLKEGMLLKIKNCYPDNHEQIVRIREIECFENNDIKIFICNEIGPDVEFSFDSHTHRYNIEEYKFSSIKDSYIKNGPRASCKNPTYYELQKQKEHWMKEAVKYQELAESRRSWFSKTGDALMFCFVLIPIRFFQIVIFRQKGPFS